MRLPRANGERTIAECPASQPVGGTVMVCFPGHTARSAGTIGSFGRFRASTRVPEHGVGRREQIHQLRTRSELTYRDTRGVDADLPSLRQ